MTDSEWKHDFPIFSANAHPDLCYLDSAATCLTPRNVADAMYYYQCFSHANSYKGLYQLSTNATEIVEQARQTVANFISAKQSREIVFTSGTTESINIIAQSFLVPRIAGKESANIVISELEHHANLLPWQRLSQQFNVQLRIAPITTAGTINVEKLASLMDEETVLVAVSHVSNVLGTKNPIADICALAKLKNIPVLVDGAQAVAHKPISVESLDCDFYVFSAHKVYGPTGCGVLYARGNHFDHFEPYNVGGGIVEHVDYQSTRFLTGAAQLEPGSRNVVSIVGLVEAIDYLHDIGWEAIDNHMSHISGYLTQQISATPFLKAIIDSSDKDPSSGHSSLIAFQMQGVHPHDVASMLDSDHVAVRAGHHCAQPLHHRFGVVASVRASLGIYNSVEDIDRLIASLQKAHKLLAIS